MIRLIVAGSRTFTDYEFMSQMLDDYLRDRDPRDIEIVSGTARGADRLGEQYAKEHGLKVIRFPADWNTYGKSAGYRRNVDMARYADACFVFWNGQSRGSQHMINIAIKEGLYVKDFISG